MEELTVALGVAAAVLTITAILSASSTARRCRSRSSSSASGSRSARAASISSRSSPRTARWRRSPPSRWRWCSSWTATKLQVDELGARWLTPARILGPGTAIVIALGAVPLALVLGFPWLVAFMGGAILASTDPVVLREVLRDERIPRSVRQVLQIEAGMNDLVVLPVLLVLIAIAG